MRSRSKPVEPLCITIIRSPFFASTLTHKSQLLVTQPQTSVHNVTITRRKALSTRHVITSNCGDKTLALNCANRSVAQLGRALRSGRRGRRFKSSHIVIPNTADMVEWARANEIEVIFARIACLKNDGKDRSLSQKKPGFNYLLMPKDSEESQIVKELSPQGDEISIIKTTDSALTGTNLRLTLHNMGITSVIVTGIFTDQCVSSTVRSLADESFDVLVLEDCCAAATDEIHHQELKIINMIYCHVLQTEDVKQLLQA